VTFFVWLIDFYCGINGVPSQKDFPLLKMRSIQPCSSEGFIVGNGGEEERRGKSHQQKTF